MDLLSKLKPVTRVIDGRSVEVTPFPARSAITNKFRLLQLIGGPLIDLIKGPLIGLVREVKRRMPDENAEITPAVILAAILDGNLDLDSITGKIFETVDPEKSTQLIFDMCSGIRINGEEVQESTLNIFFAGSLTELYKIFFFVLEVNYKDFLGGLGTTKGAVPEEKQQQKQQR